MSDHLGGWVLRELPQWNRDVLAQRSSIDDLIAQLNTEVLASAPGPDQLAPDEAKRKVVEIGLIGASVARHRQQNDLRLLAAPEGSLAPLRVTSRALPFQAYMEQLADRTGTGHPPRDAYASLVRWNAPSVEVRWQGRSLVRLASIFDDGATRTYTGHAGEQLFLTLLKKAEALEHAVNELLHPIVDGRIAVDADEALSAIRLATTLLHAVHQVNLEFIADDDTGSPRFCTTHFLDVLRQFAVHWQSGDVPPSGAQDPEFMKRDFFLGLEFPDYPRHVRRVFPALLDSERQELEDAMSLPGLPALLIRRLGIAPSALACGSMDESIAIARVYPWLIDYYLLLRANGWVAASHLMLTKRFLFKPMRERDRLGIPDSPLVSNHAGTTGMLEALLESLARPRIHHPLRAFSQIPVERLVQLSSTAKGDAYERDELLGIVRVGEATTANQFGASSVRQSIRSAQAANEESSMPA